MFSVNFAMYFFTLDPSLVVEEEEEDEDDELCLY